MRISRASLRRIIAEELAQHTRSGQARSLPTLTSILFEEMSEEDAVKAIETGVVEPLKGKADKSTVENIVAFLNSAEGKDATVRELLKMGSQDGDAGDEAIAITKTPISPATNARPTQSQIGLPNSIGYSFTTKGKSALVDALGGNVSAPGIVAAGDGGDGTTYIVDGHHRWSSSIVVNPDVNITVSMIQSSDPFKSLAVSQVVIAGFVGPGANLPSATSEPDTNLLTMSAEAIKDYLVSSVGEVLDSKASEFLSDDILDFLAGEGYGGATAEDDRDTKIDKICGQIAANCKKVPAPGDAPARKDMPQFDPKVGGPALDDVTSVFTGGDANFKGLVVPESRTRHTNDRVILERWQKLAGLIKG